MIVSNISLSIKKRGSFAVSFISASQGNSYLYTLINKISIDDLLLNDLISDFDSVTVSEYDNNSSFTASQSGSSDAQLISKVSSPDSISYTIDPEQKLVDKGDGFVINLDLYKNVEGNQVISSIQLKNK